MENIIFAIGAEKLNVITVRRRPGSARSWLGLLSFRARAYPCALGRSGIVSRKHEGDGGTPLGRFDLLYGYYRADRFQLPRTGLAMFETRAEDGWCDDPASSSYNSPVCLPHSASHEELKRSDHLYDVCLVMDYNIHPRQRGRGSAIFFHLTGKDLGPTQGCVAVEPKVMRKLLPHLNRQTQVHVCL